MKRLWIAAVLIIAGCSDKPTEPVVEAVNLGGRFDLAIVDGQPVPTSQYLSGYIVLEDTDPDPEVPDGCHASWTEPNRTLVVWGTYVAYPDSVVFDWWDDGLVGRLARRDDGLVVEVFRDGGVIAVFR